VTPRGRVLVVDDSPAIRKQVRETLEASGEFEEVHERADGFSALAAMAELKPDAVVCDLTMPGCDGITLLRLRAAKPELASIPVIMLTSNADQERKIEILERGAADYITKPFHPRELLARVRIHYRLRALQEELERANARLFTLSCTDGLTGLFNRRHLDRILESEVSRHNRYNLALSVALVDVDHFKTINDTYGHTVGDDVLRRIASSVQPLCRTADVVARYGGEEICVVLASTPLSGALTLAERLRVGIEALPHTADDGTTFRATVSVGVAGAEPRSDRRDTLTVQALLARADRALYAAKHAGRNRVCAWTAELEEVPSTPEGSRESGGSAPRS